MSRNLPGNGDADGFLSGDPRAIGVVREVVGLVVRSFQFPDPGLNKDLVQDALTRVFVNLNAGQFRGESSLRTYARRVARYTCLEYLRTRRFESHLDTDALPSTELWSQPEESFLWTEEHLRNLQVFSSLPAECRRLMMMVFIEGHSYKEIGVRLGIAEGAVKTRVHRCRAAFRQAAGLAPLGSSRPRARKVEE